jgi:4-hydroxyphenylpyruvate dioxygenase-like putative hemolysin
MGFSGSEKLRYAANSGNTGGALTVIDGSSIAHIALLGQDMAAGFQKMQDSGTGTTITYAPPPDLAPHH